MAVCTLDPARTLDPAWLLGQDCGPGPTSVGRIDADDHSSGVDSADRLVLVDGKTGGQIAID